MAVPLKEPRIQVPFTLRSPLPQDASLVLMVNTGLHLILILIPENEKEGNKNWIKLILKVCWSREVVQITPTYISLVGTWTMAIYSYVEAEKCSLLLVSHVLCPVKIERGFPSWTFNLLLSGYKIDVYSSQLWQALYSHDVSLENTVCW